LAFTDSSVGLVCAVHHSRQLLAGLAAGLAPGQQQLHQLEQLGLQCLQHKQPRGGAKQQW
jgi:hypothetical protein